MRGTLPPRKFQGLLKPVSLDRRGARRNPSPRSLFPEPSALLSLPHPQASGRVHLSFSGHSCCSCPCLASGQASRSAPCARSRPFPAGYAPLLGGELGLHPASTLGSQRSACFRTSKTRCGQFLLCVSSRRRAGIRSGPSSWGWRWAPALCQPVLRPHSAFQNAARS